MSKFNSIFAITKQLASRRLTYRDLMRSEAKIGGQLFGTIPDGHHREFFCLDQRTWVWHEEWKDPTGSVKSVTTRFEVHPGKIMKIQNGEYYQVDKKEAFNLLQAARLYTQRVKLELYPQTI